MPATEFDDSQHYGLFYKGGPLNSSTSFKVRQSELTLAALRAQGVIDMVDGLSPPAVDKLWLDKNLDPAVLKQWDPIGLAWMPVSFPTIFLRPPVLLAALEIVAAILPTDLPEEPGKLWNNYGTLSIS